MNRTARPTLLLRGINHDDLLRRYLDGEFKELSLPSEKPIFSKVYTTKHIQETGIGKSSSDDIYEYSASSTVYRVYMTNSELYKSYVAVLDKVSSPDARTEDIKRDSDIISKSIKCDHCLQPIEDDILIVPQIIKKSGTRSAVYGEFVTGHYCCALAIIDKERRADPLNACWINSENILKHIYYMTHHQFINHKAPHWKLLEANGGSMPAEIYYSGEKAFKKTPNYVFLPIKSQWETKVTLH